jgi:hypothetical protein
MSVARDTKKRSTSGRVELITKTKPRRERPMNVTKYIGMDVHSFGGRSATRVGRSAWKINWNCFAATTTS